MAANGLSAQLIARLLKIGRATLYRYCRQELRDGHIQVTAAIGAALVRSALQGNVPAQRYWLQCRAGTEWRPIEGREFGLLPPVEEAPLINLRPVWPRSPDEGD